MASSAAASRSTTPATAPDTQSSSESGALGNGLSKNGAASDDAPRLVNTTACLPFVYGSVAVYLGNKADDYNTHKWTLYLRGPNNEDLSSCIAKVVFQLHPSFAQPVRELSAPPFEVTEQGWGEFEAQIRIVWKDTSEKSTLVTHGIKLYPPGSTNQSPPTLEPVVAEAYDEAVFTDPNEVFYNQLQHLSILPKVKSNDAQVQECCLKYSDNDDFQKLVEAQRFLEKELSSVKERMALVTQETEQVEGALREVQEAKKAATAARKQKVAGNAAKKAKLNP
jgi:YEATS domain-containing protein 4